MKRFFELGIFENSRMKFTGEDKDIKDEVVVDIYFQK